MEAEDLIYDIFYKKCLTIEQVAKLTGMGRTTLYRIKNTGRMSKKSFIRLLALEFSVQK